MTKRIEEEMTEAIMRAVDDFFRTHTKANPGPDRRETRKHHEREPKPGPGPEHKPLEMDLISPSLRWTQRKKHGQTIH